MLRVIGLISIILAHTISTEGVIFQLRTFDVPLMAIVSGMAFCASAPVTIKLLPYLQKRLLRLILPTYVLLTLYFLALLAWAAIAGVPFPHTGRVLGTYLLRTGETTIGYVWVIRVFILIGISAPFLHAIWKRVGMATFMGILAGIYLLHEAMLHLPLRGPYVVRVFIIDYVWYAVGYAAVFGVGMVLYRLGRRGRFLMGIAFGGIFLVAALWLHRQGVTGLHMNDYKYPPQIYFISWGVFVSSMLAAALAKIRTGGAMRTTVQFLSAASLWIYLWHIVVLFVISRNPETFAVLDANQWLKFVAVGVVSSALALGHRFLIGRQVEALKDHPAAANFLADAFLR